MYKTQYLVESEKILYTFCVRTLDKARKLWYDRAVPKEFQHPAATDERRSTAWNRRGIEPFVWAVFIVR